MLKTRTFDLKIFKINFELHRALEWCVYYRYHFKRYVKRYLPSFKLTCDFCGGKVKAWPMSGPLTKDRANEEEWWYAGCTECMKKVGWGHFAGGPTENSALEKWERTGGEEFLGKVHFRAPPWLWKDRDSLGLNRLYNLFHKEQRHADKV